jgi:hypothetical protein
MNLNKQLKSVYEPYLEELKVLSKEQADKFSYPLLMKVFPDYETVNKKVLYVGKETYTWIDTMDNCANLSVEYIMDSYEEFAFAKDYHGRNSPFWRFIKTFHESINGKDSPNGLLWTNFSKCDSNGTTPDYNLQKLNDKGFDLLLEELKIVNPDIVIFITGWDYERQFQRVFIGLEYKTIEESYLYKCVHSALPSHSYMTMHPKGLQIRKKFNSTLNNILENITAV